VDSTFRDDRRSRVHGEYLEELSEFSLNDIRTLLEEEQIAKKFLGTIGRGKEANVYWIKDYSNRNIAVKLFRLHTTSHGLQSLHSKAKLSDTAMLGVVEGLCHREYLNLHYMYDAGVRVPKPREQLEFMYTMDFLGTKRGPDPLLLEVDLVKEGHEPIDVLDDIFEQMHLMFNEAEMVHGDFSEHNLVWHENEAWIIDVLQSQRYHPRYHTGERIRKRDALPILSKDVKNINKHFIKKYRIGYDYKEVMTNMVEDEVDDWIPDQAMGENYDLDSWVNMAKKKAYE
jgi:serine/threonine-protein kinase RIO1